MKPLFRKQISALLYHGAKFFPAAGTGTRILCYHRVRDIPQDYLSVPVTAFHEQMQFLFDRGYKTVSLSEIVDPGWKPSGREVLLTFDDGFRDNYEKAFPVLATFGFTATVFCVADLIGRSEYLSEAQILEMRTAGIEFGSHTLTHPRLHKLYTAEKWKEIAMSKEVLEKRLGFEMPYFCYPFGQFDRECVAMAEKAGYRAACSNRPGANRQIEPFLLQRTEISGADDLEDFEKKMAGAFDLLHQGLHMLRGRP